MPPAPPTIDRSSQLDASKDDVATRRFSASTPAPGSKESRRDPLPPQADLLAGRAESSTAKYGSRTSSPPPPGPQVPAFGSFSVKPSIYSGPTSNVWKAPAEIRPNNPPARVAAAPVVPIAPISIPKAVPTAPKAQLNPPPPAAPRSFRGLEVGQQPPFPESIGDRVPAAPKSWNAGSAQPSVPTAPWALRGEERSQNPFTQPPSRDGRSLSVSHQSSAPTVPVSPRLSQTPARPLDLGPSPAGSLHSQTTASESGARDSRYPRTDTATIRSGTPPPTAPSGPRRTHSFSTSPVLRSPNIPTAPKAIRGPPVAPRAVADRGTSSSNRPLERSQVAPSRAPPNAPRAPAWNQWIRPGAPIYREPSIPAKRDSNGEEKPTVPRLQASPVSHSGRRLSEPSAAVKAEETQEDFRPRKTSHGHDQRTGSIANETGMRGGEYDRSHVNLRGPPQPLPTTAAQVETPAVDTSSEEVSDDEGMDLDEEDFAQSKAKFERQKAQLENKLLDLSSRQYRAVTPLEQISRLARVSEQDLGMVVEPALSAEKRFPEEMDVETEQLTRPSSAADEDEDQQKLLTPKQEELEDLDDIRNAMGESDPMDNLMPTAPPSAEGFSLPFLVKSPLTPLSERGAMQETIARHSASKSAIIAHLEGDLQDVGTTEEKIRDEYLQTYRRWTLELELLDRSRVKKERDDRQASVEPGPDVETSLSTADLPTAESSRSRLHKFSSEYDIQKVLKESEETARIEQERLDRESKKIQADLEREAAIPEIYDEAMRQRRVYKDTNRYRSASRLTEIFGYEPPRDTFTEEEHKKFLELFKDRPKKWGEIAAQLPGRTYADCIHHYYAFKWDGRFRETKRKGKGKGGRGRGGKAAPRTRGSALMADLGRGEEDATNASAVTETGRPRRAATRTTYGEKESESKGVAVGSTSTLGKKAAPSLEPGSEKPAKRRKAASGEKGVKRGRQPIAAAPAASPATYDKESIPSKEDLAHAQSLEEASLLTGLQAGRRGLQADTLSMFAHENLSQLPNAVETGERTRHPGQPPLQRSSASSYWSVPEQTDFVKFINHFGTDFAGIANHMGTKTQTMVSTIM